VADHSQKTEQPTARRIQRARREGHYPLSQEALGAFHLLGVLTFVLGMAPWWWPPALEAIRATLRAAFRTHLSPEAFAMQAVSALWPLLAVLALVAVVLTAAAVMVQLGLTGFGLSVNKLAPDWTRLNPANRLRQLPGQNFAQFLRAVLVLPLIALGVALVLGAYWDALVNLPRWRLNEGLRVGGDWLTELVWRAAGLVLLLGLIELWRQRRRYHASLRMSKQEIREEIRETDGHPQIKARIRRMQREFGRRRMMSRVPEATAIVVNPTHFAVALRYVPREMTAPKVIAKGKNYLAARIRKIALDHQVPIVENPPLAQALYRSAEVGQEIPAALYRAVAEVLAYIYRLAPSRLS
jgi:flagellar biosynthetic protein FlhB